MGSGNRSSQSEGSGRCGGEADGSDPSRSHVVVDAHSQLFAYQLELYQLLEYQLELYQLLEYQLEEVHAP
ncbi:MAG: hypothetical protein QOJ79_727 [Actinomycetota bacterium]|nr:hypothetical protein [Actinomycetota bacterium]